MGVRVWITTHRRPELVKRCLRSLTGSGFITMLLHSNDEEHQVFENVIPVRLPIEASGVGAGAPRDYAGRMALETGDSAMIYMDDDVVCWEDGTYLWKLLETLRQNPVLGAVTARDPLYSGKKPFDGDDDLRLMDNLFACTAIRMSAYKKVGGFDSGMGWGEDKDLCLRLQVGGWLVVQNREVGVDHRRGQEGGMIAQASSLANTKRYIDRVVEKYPDGVIRATKHSFMFKSQKQLERLQEAYADGRLELSAEHIRFKP